MKITGTHFVWRKITFLWMIKTGVFLVPCQAFYICYVFLGTKVHSVSLVENLWLDKWWLHMHAWILFMTDCAICL